VGKKLGRDFKKGGSTPTLTAPLIRDMTKCRRPVKVAYLTKAEAKKFLKRQRGISRKGMEPYRCECGAWHLGHKATPS
jgi:hypothetical protein